MSLHAMTPSRIFSELEVRKMARLTIRNLDDDIKQRLRIQAAEHGRSMEEEVRAILRAALTGTESSTNLARAIGDRFAPLGGVELELPSREPMRDPPQFG